MIENLPLERVRVSLAAPTREGLLAEAAALGERFPEVSAHPADLIADAEEMLEARGDLPALEDRDYSVSDGLFVRIELLKDELAPMLAEEHQTSLLSEAQKPVGRLLHPGRGLQASGCRLRARSGLQASGG